MSHKDKFEVQNCDATNNFNTMINRQIEATEIYKKLKSTNNMCEIGSIIDNLKPEMLRQVLKTVIYDRK